MPDSARRNSRSRDYCAASTRKLSNCTRFFAAEAGVKSNCVVASAPVMRNEKPSHAFPRASVRVSTPSVAPSIRPLPLNVTVRLRPVSAVFEKY